jgi:hypothetical protein
MWRAERLFTKIRSLPPTQNSLSAALMFVTAILHLKLIKLQQKYEFLHKTFTETRIKRICLGYTDS